MPSLLSRLLAFSFGVPSRTLTPGLYYSFMKSYVFASHSVHSSPISLMQLLAQKNNFIEREFIVKRKWTMKFNQQTSFQVFWRKLSSTYHVLWMPLALKFLFLILNSQSIRTQKSQEEYNFLKWLKKIFYINIIEGWRELKFDVVHKFCHLTLLSGVSRVEIF